MSEESSEQPIIIKKIKKGGGHHGGAWKVAYADFVTAMMAFFLLLWLLNVSTDEQKAAISNYFDPTHPKVSSDQSGAGGVMGGLTMSPKGSMASNVQPITTPRPSATRLQGAKLSPEKVREQKAKEKARREEDRKFKQKQEELKQRIESSPQLKDLAKNLMIDVTPEGLRIQIIDRDGNPMFPSGSAQMFQKTRDLLAAITEVIAPLENEISVRGHTDAVPYGPGASYTNWELSSDRANASRRVMIDNNMPTERVNNVMGKADTELLIPEDPRDAKNRRITLLLLREELTNPQAFEEYLDEVDAEMEGEGFNDDEPAQVPVGTFRKTPGKVEFP